MNSTGCEAAVNGDTKDDAYYDIVNIRLDDSESDAANHVTEVQKPDTPTSFPLNWSLGF